MKTSGNTILMTGGGSGIGEALAHRFHDRGDTVIVAGRTRDALDRACEGRERMHATVLDVADPDDISAFARRVVAEHPALDVLFNNAGIMRFEDTASEHDLADAEAQVATNLLGPIRLTNALMEHLKGRPDSAIVTVTSGLAYVPLVDAPTYCATKAAIHSWTVSLRDALKDRVEVIELTPPAVQTTLTPGQEDREGYLPLDDFADEVMALFDRRPTPPEVLVEKVMWQRGAEARGEFDQVFGQLNAFARAVR